MVQFLALLRGPHLEITYIHAYYYTVLYIYIYMCAHDPNKIAAPKWSWIPVCYIMVMYIYMIYIDLLYHKLYQKHILIKSHVIWCNCVTHHSTTIFTREGLFLSGKIQTSRMLYCLNPHVWWQFNPPLTIALENGPFGSMILLNWGSATYLTGVITYFRFVGWTTSWW